MGLDSKGGRVGADARPSDAVDLGLRSGARIGIAEELAEEAKQAGWMDIESRQREMGLTRLATECLWPESSSQD